MISPDYLRTLFAYHEWATLRVLNTAAQLDPPALDATPLAGLGSLRQILVHALSADYAADGRIIISYRPSAAAGEREPDGRLFTAIPPGELALLLES
ncbi:MAG: hypothetical protein WCF99_15995, partial [Chloroflexales bacterium]